MEEKGINSIVEDLEKSPMFNLSLSSKELFHSNFLYWFGKNYSTEMGKLFSVNDEVQVFNKEEGNLKREQKYIDLSFQYENGQNVIIENKVKSLPNKAQLKRYSKDREKDICILLSLSEPKFDLELKNGVKWHYLSYEELGKRLTESLDNVQKENEYHHQIVKDYCAFIDGLVELNKSFEIKEDDCFSFHIKNKKDKKEETEYQKLEKIRLHDFYLKKKYELLAYKVYERLKEQEDSKNYNLIEFGEPLNWKSEKPELFLGSGMTNSQGLMDLKYLISKDIALGIQIQGESYRMVVEDRTNKDADELKGKLLENKLWFQFNRNEFNNKTIYPQPTKTNPYKKFNKFGNNFFYKSVKLGTELTIENIIDIIVEDVQKIENNLKEIQKLIK